jgi:hypothetical protein
LKAKKEKMSLFEKGRANLNRIQLNGIRQILPDPGKFEKPIVLQCSKFLGVALPLFPRRTKAAGSDGRAWLDL